MPLTSLGVRRVLVKRRDIFRWGTETHRWLDGASSGRPSRAFADSRGHGSFFRCWPEVGDHRHCTGSALPMLIQAHERNTAVALVPTLAATGARSGRVREALSACAWRVRGRLATAC